MTKIWLSLKAKREEFLKKYEKEIKAYRTERLIGSGALRDYNFSSLPENILKNLDSYPPFNGYVYQNGILCAKIKIEDKYFYLPPIYDEDTDKHCLKVIQNNL